MIRRLPDWQPRLLAFLAGVARHPFEEGSHDCALFFASAVAAMTGQDHAAPYRGRYQSTRAGLRLLRRDGFEDHIALAAHHLPETPPALLNVGDGAVIPAETGPALGVVQGARIYVPMAGGLGLVPLTAAIRGFEV